MNKAPKDRPQARSGDTRRGESRYAQAERFMRLRNDGMSLSAIARLEGKSVSLVHMVIKRATKEGLDSAWFA